MDDGDVSVLSVCFFFASDGDGCYKKYAGLKFPVYHCLGEGRERNRVKPSMYIGSTTSPRTPRAPEHFFGYLTLFQTAFCPFNNLTSTRFYPQRMVVVVVVVCVLMATAWLMWLQLLFRQLRWRQMTFGSTQHETAPHSWNLCTIGRNKKSVI